MFSSNENMLIGIIVCVYFVFLFSLSLYINKRKIKTYDDYNVAGRSVSVFPLILTFVGTAVGGSILLGFMTDGYTDGMGQQWLNNSIFITGIITAFFLVRRIRFLGEKYHMVTLGDFTALRYGEAARVPTVISVLCAYCAVTGMQFVAIATILKLTIGLNMTIGIIISWLLLTLKTYFGGLKSVIWQDAVHGTLQTVGVFILFFAILAFAGDWSSMTSYASSLNEGYMFDFNHITMREVFVYFCTIGGYQFVRQDLWQRFWAAKSYKTAIYGYWASIIVGLLVGAAVIAIGVMARYGLGLDNVDPTLIYYHAIDAVFNFPMVVVMIIALMATVISCADSFFMAGSSSIINDIIKPRMKYADDARILWYSRLSVVTVSIIALLLALYLPQLVDLWVVGTAMLVSGLLAPAFFGLFWKGATKTGGITAMWLGLIVAVIWQLAGHPFGIHPVFIGLPLSTIAIVVVSLLTRPQKQYQEDIWAKAE